MPPSPLPTPPHPVRPLDACARPLPLRPGARSTAPVAAPRRARKPRQRKPIRETRDLDIRSSPGTLSPRRWAQLRDSEFPRHVPVGVVGQIIPWNFPLLMVAWKVAPASAGNTVILKPAEFTPLTALCFAEIAQAAALPPGVFNVVTGDGATGKHLVEHPRRAEDRLHRSTEVAASFVRRPPHGKKLTLELGGKSRSSCRGCHLDSVVEGVVDAICFNQGQCAAPARGCSVQEGIADRLTQKLRARMEKLRSARRSQSGRQWARSWRRCSSIASAACGEGSRGGGQDVQPSWACPTGSYSIRRRCSPTSHRATSAARSSPVSSV